MDFEKKIYEEILKRNLGLIPTDNYNATKEIIMDLHSSLNIKYDITIENFLKAFVVKYIEYLLSIRDIYKSKDPELLNTLSHNSQCFFYTVLDLSPKNETIYFILTNTIALYNLLCYEKSEYSTLNFIVKICLSGVAQKIIKIDNFYFSCLINSAFFNLKNDTAQNFKDSLTFLTLTMESIVGAVLSEGAYIIQELVEDLLGYIYTAYIDCIKVNKRFNEISIKFNEIFLNILLALCRECNQIDKNAVFGKAIESFIVKSFMYDFKDKILPFFKFLISNFSETEIGVDLNTAIIEFFFVFQRSSIVFEGKIIDTCFLKGVDEQVLRKIMVNNAVFILSLYAEIKDVDKDKKLLNILNFIFSDKEIASVSDLSLLKIKELFYEYFKIKFDIFGVNGEIVNISNFYLKLLTKYPIEMSDSIASRHVNAYKILFKNGKFDFTNKRNFFTSIGLGEGDFGRRGFKCLYCQIYIHAIALIIDTENKIDDAKIYAIDSSCQITDSHFVSKLKEDEREFLKKYVKMLNIENFQENGTCWAVTICAVFEASKIKDIGKIVEVVNGNEVISDCFLRRIVLASIALFSTYVSTDMTRVIQQNHKDQGFEFSSVKDPEVAVYGGREVLFIKPRVLMPVINHYCRDSKRFRHFEKKLLRRDCQIETLDGREKFRGLAVRLENTPKGLELMTK